MQILCHYVSATSHLPKRSCGWIHNGRVREKRCCAQPRKNFSADAYKVREAKWLCDKESEVLDLHQHFRSLVQPLEVQQVKCGRCTGASWTPYHRHFICFVLGPEQSIHLFLQWKQWNWVLLPGIFRLGRTTEREHVCAAKLQHKKHRCLCLLYLCLSIKSWY